MFIFKLLARFITFLVVLALAIPTFAIARTWYEARDRELLRADAIVLMGAAQLDGRPGEVLTARLEEVKRIYDDELASQIFTLGARAPGDRFTEAGVARDWLGKSGVPWRNIAAIKIGRDSYSSLAGLARSVGTKNYRSIIIVTDPYHCLRSKTIAADFGYEASCSPVKTGIASLDRVGVRYLVREAGAYLAYITLGRRGIHLSDHVAWKL